MSEEPHTPKTPKGEHGTTGSYIIGFILSLVFTIIPYYMVVNKTLTGNALLLVILSIGVLQMFIQIFFFLHLGRGPKPLYNVVFFFATAGIIVIVISASVFIMNNLYRNMTPQEVTRKLAQDEAIAQISGTETGACQANKSNHIVTINEGVANPSLVEADLCDTVTFINEDKFDREIAFGIHPEDVSYGGEFEVHIGGGDSETITLNEPGDFAFHDHLDQNLIGSLLVSQ